MFNYKRIKSFVDLLTASEVSGLVFEEKGFKVDIEQSMVNRSSRLQPEEEPIKEINEVQTDSNPSVSLAEYFRSDRVGIFYLSEKKDEPPIATVGKKFKAGDVVCIIKAMNIKNNILAENDFVVKAIVAEEDKPVEYGQSLFEIVIID